MPSITTLDSIPVETAVAYTSAWREAKHVNEDYARAFTITLFEMEELVALAKQMDANAIRVYLGLERIPGTEIDEQKLVLVTVAGFDAGKRTAGFEIVEYPDNNNPGNTISGCFDFTYPCPDTCSKSSILLNGTA